MRLKYRGLFEALQELLRETQDDSFCYSSMTINFNVETKEHKDSCNKGPSKSICLGDFSGGKLHVCR